MTIFSNTTRRAAAAATTTAILSNDPFDAFAGPLRVAAEKFLLDPTKPLFRTDAGDKLFDIFLESFDDPVERQHHNCNCCKHFLRRFGGLVTVDDNGLLIPVAWEADFDAVPELYHQALAHLFNAVASASITSEFHSRDAVLGTPEAGGFHHFYLQLAANRLFTERLRTPGQAMADSAEHFRVLRSGILSFEHRVFETALALLEGDAVLRADKFVGPARAYLTLSEKRNDGNFDNFVWLAMAKQGKGFYGLRSSAFGTMLHDLQAGLDVAQVKARFASVVNPLTYQRPTAAPRVGQIQRAEQIVDKLGLREAFPRRVAEYAEALEHAAWIMSSGPNPTTVQVPSPKLRTPGMFSHLASTQVQAAQGAATTMTFQRFMDTVAGRAKHIQLVVPRTGPFGSITAPVIEDAPPLFSWDKESNRNPYSWYKWTDIDASDFGLTEGAANEVLCIVPTPPAWSGDLRYPGALLLLTDAEDQRLDIAGTGLFPEALHSELQEARAVIMAHSNQDTLVVLDPTVQQAAGLWVRKGTPINVTLRVHTSSATLDYFIDRWE